MTERELLELVAKAAGYEVIEHRPNVFHLPSPKGRNYLGPAWDPLADDGDAQRLAVKLGISVCQDEPIEVAVHEYQGVCEGEYEMGVEAWIVNPEISCATRELYGSDRFKATRRAIVRVAAAIQQAREAK